MSVPAVAYAKPPVDPATITWRTQEREPFWQRVPAWADVTAEQFLDWSWQERNALTRPEDLRRLLGERVDDATLADVQAGTRAASMSLRLPPYVLSLIDWAGFYDDPLRRQFLPVESEQEADHPLASFDHGEEQSHAPTPGLTHRYFDRVLFLTTDRCPVYCRHCTRSYAVGPATAQVVKRSMAPGKERWDAALRYVAERPEVEDVVVSGGDVFRLRPDQLQSIGSRLLAIAHVRRIRFATRGIAVQPMRVLSDPAWVGVLTELAASGRAQGKEVSVHTHFNHPREVSWITQDAAAVLFAHGIPVRNLSVILRKVNDDPATQIELARRLAYMNIRPYYTYACDLVASLEDLRVPLWRCMEIEKVVRGALTGHHTPVFVVDVPGGGGKRDLHSFEHYDRETGISLYTAPSVRPGEIFAYVDPLRDLSPDVAAAWARDDGRAQMLERAVGSAGFRMTDLATDLLARQEHNHGGRR